MGCTRTRNRKGLICKCKRTRRITATSAETWTPSTGTAADSESARHNHLQRWNTQVALSATFIHSFNNRRNQGNQTTSRGSEARHRGPSREGLAGRERRFLSRPHRPIVGRFLAIGCFSTCGFLRDKAFNQRQSPTSFFPERKPLTRLDHAHLIRRLAARLPPSPPWRCLGKWRPSRSACFISNFSSQLLTTQIGPLFSLRAPRQFRSPQPARLSGASPLPRRAQFHTPIFVTRIISSRPTIQLAFKFGESQSRFV